MHSEDSTGNASDSSFVITVKDSTGPTITQISNQSSEVYNPIHPITISTTDNSGAKVVAKYQACLMVLHLIRIRIRLVARQVKWVVLP